MHVSEVPYLSKHTLQLNIVKPSLNIIFFTNMYQLLVLKVVLVTKSYWLYSSWIQPTIITSVAFMIPRSCGNYQHNMHPHSSWLSGNNLLVLAYLAVETPQNQHRNCSIDLGRNVEIAYHKLLSGYYNIRVPTAGHFKL